MKLRGADIVVNILREQNIKTVFGYPGGTVAPLYDALYKNRQFITHIRTAGEQGAAHGADGFARATGKAAVCISTSGPGATNLVTGIATAFADSTPVVYITANVPVWQIGTDSFQEVDITGITIPITKYNKMVKDGAELAYELRRAFEIAESGRKGPVLIDIPKDVLENKYEYFPGEAAKKEERQSIKGDIEGTVSLIEKAERPMILAGGGVRMSGASEELYRFAKIVGAPVSCTMMALGEYPCSDEQYIGNAGAYGPESVRRAIRECDLLIAVGSRFSSRTELTEKILKDKTVIHIDSDRAEINKNVTASSYILGDAGEALRALNRRLEEKQHKQTGETKKWLLSLSESSEKDSRADKTSGNVFDMKKAICTASETGRFDSVVTDVGMHQVMTAAFYGFERPGEFVTSGGLGTMGFGLGAAIGVYEATKGRVLLITGDGSFGMELQELATVKRYNIPITILIMNNGALGMVKEIQKSRYGGRFSETLIKKNDISYVKLARSFGIDAVKVTDGEQLSKAIKSQLNSEKQLIIDCRVR